MTCQLFRHLLALGCVLAGWCHLAAEPIAAPKVILPDLSEYRTVEKAVAAPLIPTRPGVAGQTGYLGLAVERDGRGRLVVEEVQAESPADRAGLKKGDVIQRVGGQPVWTTQAFREWLQTRGPGESVKLDLLRADKAVEVSATLAATSRPMKLGGPRAFLGVELAEAKEGEGVPVEQVVPDSPAAEARLKKGDRILKLDGIDFTRAARLTDILSEKKPGDVLTLAVRRDGKDVELKARLTLDRERPARGGREGPPSGPWRKEVLRLAVVCIEFSNVKHNGKVPLKEWEEAFFSRGRYAGKKNATGQPDRPVQGSLSDYWFEQSCGALRLDGKVFDWVDVGKKRDDYVQGSGTSNKTALLVEALNKVTARDGKDACKDFDGFLFLYAGERVPTNRGALYYPHAGSVSHQNKRYPYLLGAEGGAKMSPIGAFVKELGQVLGLPDLAARPENPGSRGLGVWCAMSSPLDGRPQDLCAWSKEKMGWLKPISIDPTVKQKLILGPSEGSATECFKVLVRLDGSEYLLLENRQKVGFDAGLPGEGLLIWRIVNDRPLLHESHGVEGPIGPTIHLGAVPFPSAANNAFTPDTIPSSRSPQGGGLPVHLTEIRRLPDGRLTFHIGYEYR